MKHVTLAAMTAAFLGILAQSALAQATTLRLAHVAPPQSSYQAAAERFAAELTRISDGEIAVDIIPGGVLGDLGQLWVQTRTGALDLHLIDLSALIVMREARPFLALWTPFLFRDQAHLHRFVDSDIFSEMMGAVEEATGVVYLGYVGDRPPRALTTAGTAVRTPADMAGLRIRTPEHPMIIGAFEFWGASPTPIAAAELFTALRTGLVDGQDNGVIDFLGAGYAEAQRYYMPLDYIHSGLGVWISPQAWAGLDETRQRWLRVAAERAGATGIANHESEMEAALARLAELGVELVEPDIDTFRPAREAIAGRMEGDVWPAGLIDRIDDL